MRLRRLGEGQISLTFDSRNRCKDCPCRCCLESGRFNSSISVGLCPNSTDTETESVESESHREGGGQKERSEEEPD